MDILIILAFLIGGLVLMIKSADFFVDAAVKIAELSGIPKLIVGATIVSLATTLPELFVSTTAILAGKNEMAVGNALGSVIFNTAVVLSVATLFMAGNVDRRNIIEKATILILSLGALTFFALDLQINTVEGISLFGFVVIYTILNVRAARRQQDKLNRVQVDDKKKAYIINSIILIVSAIGIRFGAKFLVDGATMIAEKSGASEQVIGLTVLAMGTSLPELATTITSIIKREQSLSVGNVIGANILNITLIMGTAGILSKNGLTIKKLPLLGFDQLIPQTLYLDLPFIFIIILLFVIPIFLKGKIYKWQGFIGLSLYGIYLTYLLLNA